ncbi:MAG TPA: type II toxin-antitoxin system RelE/ParE family toxin [Gallionella sp.]|jgi:plasmid stabilization system protein ParE|nr:type II toxin-antitoxin system RelE/ParE family toxin [Gallionella sp.]
MPRLIWSPSALQDVRHIHHFLFEKNPAAANEAVSVIRNAVKIIAQHPEIGRPAAEMEPEFREWPIPFGGSGYLALYRFDGDTAVILALRHQREAGY